jgi:virulence factor Mce-like protein
VAFRAQDGLPAQATYRVHADVPDAGKLTEHADVRIGGARVGHVLKIVPQPPRGSRPPFTRLELQLDSDAGPLPAGTRTEVRLASVLGGKYVSLTPTRRHGGPTIPEGGVIPLSNAIRSVDIDDALRVFGPASRADTQRVIGALGDALAGRGADVNDALGTTSRLLPGAQRVLRVLIDPRTDLPGFLRGAATAGEAIAPVSRDLGRVLDRAAGAFGAVDAAGPRLEEALAVAPSAEAETRRALAEVRPALADARAIATSLAPAGDVLESTVRRVDGVVRTATPVAAHSATLAPAIDEALRALGRFTADPAAAASLDALRGSDLATFGGSAFVGLGAILNTLADAQLNCNAAAIWARNLQSLASEGNSTGHWLRMIAIQASGESEHAAQPAPGLHVNPYPNENAGECEAGNEPFPDGQRIGNPPGDQPRGADMETAGRAGR